MEEGVVGVISLLDITDCARGRRLQIAKTVTASNGIVTRA